MERNRKAHVGTWVDERLATLDPDSEWRANVIQGLEGFRERRGSRSDHRMIAWTWTVAMGVAACISLMALPAPRQLARRCLEQCTALWQSVSISGSVRAANVVPEKDRKMAADFALDGGSGKPVRLADFRGRVVLLNFWATWCHGCGVEIPWFVEFENTYRSKGFAVVGVSMDDDGWTSVKPYVAQKKMNYAVVIGSEDVAKRYALGAMPMTLLVDTRGRIAATHVGVVSRSDCQSEIETLLKENGTAATAIRQEREWRGIEE
jgi:peroxiredoxin